MLKNKHLFFLLCTILSIFLSNFVFVNSVFASVNNITKIVFTTKPQIPAPIVGELSKVITVRAQDSYGNNQVFDDADGLLKLSTNSPTGEFFSNTSSLDPVKVLDINDKRWSGRNFYYRDSSEGNFIITVKLSIVSNSGKSWTATQNIRIGTPSTVYDSDLGNDNSNPDIPVSTTTSDVSNQKTQTAKIVDASTHSSPEDLSNYAEKSAFEIVAGRERMASVGSPVEFSAKYSLSQEYSCQPDFVWTFGDGFQSVGKNVSHAYKYSGKYQVVLNGKCGDYTSVSRTSVDVIAPNISIKVLKDKDIEISNNDKTEINIGGWKISGFQKDFTFPRDTIVSATSKIILSKEDIVPNASATKISLINPSGGEVAFIVLGQQANAVSSLATTSPSIASSSNYISAEEPEKLLKNNKDPLVLKNSQNYKKNISLSATATVVNNKENITETASVATAVSSSSIKSFWDKLIGIPLKGIKSFAHMFYIF